MPAAKKKNEKFTTPAGIASYPYLVNPDTKFNPEGEYKVSLMLSASDAAPLIKLIEGKMEEQFNLIKNEAKGPKAKKAVKMSDAPYSNVEDDEGDETGEIKINFKQRALVTRKKDKKTFEMKVALFDAKGNSFKPKGYVGGGSKVKVAFEIIPFYTKMIGAGVSLRLRAVQILELVDGDGVTADSYGFDEEEGFEAPVKSESEELPFDKDEDEDF